MSTSSLCALRAAAILAIAVSPAFGQSFNVDIDSPASPPTLGGGVPSSLFPAAAAQPGVWNSVPGTSGPIPLVGLNGLGTTATIAITASSTGVGTTAFNNPSNTGDFALLFNDGSQIGTTAQGGSRTYQFSGLLNGAYAVYTYGAHPTGNNAELHVDVIGSNEGLLTVSGALIPNTFTLGNSHVVHTLNVATGSLSIRMTDTAGSPAAYVSGFQLVLIPAPGAVSALALGGILAARRRR